jgi:hypothetical protein
MRAKYRYLLDDADVKRWFDNLARGSIVTAESRLRILGNFCVSVRTDPKSLLKLSDEDITNTLMDYVTKLEKEKYAGSYIESILKTIKSWLSHNHRELKGKIKIKGARDTPTLREERTPTTEELRNIFLSAGKKVRVSAILMAHSGLRVETIGNYKGTDGLRIKDFPEMKIENGNVSFQQIPTLLIVRHELSKAGHQYLTFLSEEGCQYLQDYIEERIRKGEEITSESPIVTPQMSEKEFIRSVNVGDGIRGAIRKAGFSARPYALRSFFDTELMLAESKGLVLRDYRTFWMGHKGDIENRYTTNRCKLPENVIEDMREAYERSQPYLQTLKVGEPAEEKLQQSFRKQLLLVTGFSEAEIREIAISSITDEQMQDMIRTRLLGIGSNQTKQKVVDVNELEKYLAQGWDFISNLPNSKVLIRNLSV